MTDLILGQMDFVLFVYGLSFVLAGLVCVGTRGEGRGELPWHWLALFAVAHGMAEWLEAFKVGLLDGPGWDVLRLATLGVSFVFLLEFGRAAAPAGGRLSSWWLYLAAGLLGACRGLSPSALAVTLRYGPGFVGACAAAVAFWKAGARPQAGSAWLRRAGLLLAAYAAAAGLVGPAAPFAPASFLNQDAFLRLTGLPVQLLRAALACALAGCLWLFSQERRAHRYPEAAAGIVRGARYAVLAVAAIVALGGLLTARLGAPAAAAHAAARDVALARFPGILLTMLAGVLFLAAFILRHGILQADEEVARAFVDYHELFSNMGAGFLYGQAVGEAGRLSDVTVLSGNAALREHVGLDAENAAGRGLKELFPFIGAGCLATLEGVVTSGKPASFECRAEPLKRWLSVSAYRPRPGHLALLIEDVSGRKRMEAALTQSEKLSAVGQLAAGVAHEINNPLGVILGFAQAAAKRIEPSDALALPLKTIEREALRCKTLVQDLLTFSRQGPARAESFDLNEAVEETLNIVEAQARLQNVRIERDLGALDAFVGDRSKLQQAVVNLCSNSLDAMPGGGAIAVRTRAKDDGVVLEVRDTGEGIPESIQGRIFEPFFTTKEVGKGTGLGLALVYETVKKHRGSIRCESRVGAGTAFIIELPRRAGDGNEG